MENAAVISECGKYRYLLVRELSHNPGCAIFVMLNPSTADAAKDDPTIRKCMGFANRWGYGQLRVVNLFAYRATSPKDMLAASDPVGEENKYWVDQTLRHNDGTVICAWGTNGSHMEQDLEMMGWLDSFSHRFKPMALDVTKDGHPKHPLYVPYEKQPMLYAGRRWKVVKGNSIPESATNQSVTA